MKIQRQPWTALLCVVAVLTVVCVNAHGFLTAPKVEFRTNHEDPTAYSGTIDGATALPAPDGMHYGWGPSLAAEAFTAAFGNSSYTTLREFVMKHQKLEPSTAISLDCGRTKEDASVPQQLPDMVVWQHGDNEGFTLSHEGPCELWCDNERVFVEKNCAKTYPLIPAKLPYERAKCVGKKRLQMVWLALHEGTRWQVYMNCAPLTGTEASMTTPASADATTNTGLGTVHPSTSLYPTPTAKPYSPTPSMKTTRPPVEPNGSYVGIHTHPATRPPAINAPIYVRTKVPNSTEDGSQDATSGSGSEAAPCIQFLRPLPTHTKPFHIRPHSTHPPRRVSAVDAVEDDGSLSPEEDLALYESGNPYAQGATGPIPAAIYEAARKDFEEEQKRKAERRAALKKEFGYA